MRFGRTGFIFTACASLLLAACGSGNGGVQGASPEDPAITAALNAPITYDPDLSTMNRANSAASLPTQDGSLPTVESGPGAIAAARAEALELVGGAGRMRRAPEPGETSNSLPPEAALTAAARAAATPRVSGDCAQRVSYTMQWAARMPPAFPVYPRGAVQEAAGTDEGHCALRVVNFVSPVPLDEVIDFYFTRARNAGFSTEHILQGGDNVLTGAKGGRSFAVYIRELPAGLTEIDLVTSG